MTKVALGHDIFCGCLCLMAIEVVKYQPEWAQWFEQERVLLEGVLAPWLHQGIHHIGSTSVPGLSAKSIIDIICGVRDLTEAHAAIEPLAALNYQHAEHRPRALWFFKPGDGTFADRSHHLHLTEPGSDLWQERLAFRDALRANRELAEEYEALKLGLSAEHTTEAAEYTRGKRPFVTRVLAGGGIELP